MAIPWAAVKAGIGIVSNALNNANDTKEDSGTQLRSIPQYNFGNVGASDSNLKNKERLERLFGGDGAIDAFSKIDAYVYKYNDKAKELYPDGDRGIDDSQHFGPMAQDLAQNPITSGTVHEDDNGYLMVDTRQLTLTNTAMISQLARKVQELEERLGGK